MTNNNNLKPIIESKKPFEIVQEIENYQIKKSPLSPAARSKVVKRYGGNFLSDNKKGYGPCEYYSCPYSSSCRFYLKIGFSGRNIKFYEETETDHIDDFYWLTMKNIQEARDALRKFEKGNANTSNRGCYYVTEMTSTFDFGTTYWSGNTQNARRKQGEIMLELKNCIDSHERGNEVYKTGVDFKPGDGGCSVIM